MTEKDYEPVPYANISTGPLPPNVHHALNSCGPTAPYKTPWENVPDSAYAPLPTIAELDVKHRLPWQQFLARRAMIEELINELEDAAKTSYSDDAFKSARQQSRRAMMTDLIERFSDKLRSVQGGGDQMIPASDTPDDGSAAEIVNLASEAVPAQTKRAEKAVAELAALRVIISEYERTKENSLQSWLLAEQDYQQEIAKLRDENEELRGIITQHDLCHNLHGKVDAINFADGCATEQRKLYGCAPHADRAESSERELAALRKTLEEQLSSVHGLPDRKYIVDAMPAFAAEAIAKRDAEIAVLKVDVERYRWLRSQTNRRDGRYYAMPQIDSHAFAPGTGSDYCASFDSCIDAAREGGK